MTDCKFTIRDLMRALERLSPDTPVYLAQKPATGVDSVVGRFDSKGKFVGSSDYYQFGGIGQSGDLVERKIVILR